MRLASQGVILEQNYVQPVCSPTRAALMTGRYPYRYGMQNGVFKPLEPKGLPLGLPFLAEELQNLGYSTHAIGKWHLGHCKWNYTPTYRGFDSFRGYYLGSESYYNHVRKVGNNYTGYDFRNGTEVDWDANGTYSTKIFGEEAVKVVNQSALEASPFFLYLAFQAVHAPLEVPPRYEKMYSNITNKDRRIFCGKLAHAGIRI
ncbi:unnamed protein product [Ixodes hexagonus]